MFRLLTIVGILTAMFVSEAKAICLRCRRNVCACHVVRKVVAPAYVPAAAVVPQQTLFVVQNSYPPPIGAYAAQGQTLYGVQQASLAYQVNHAEVLRQSAELARAASATAQIGLTGYNQTAGTALAISASISEPLARGHAASQVLTAAGLSHPSQQQQSLALRITRGADGQWQVHQAEAGAINAQVEASINEHTVPPAPKPQPERQSILAAKCAECHGLALTEPKGSTYIDAGHPLSCEVVVKALKLLKAGKMPKAPKPPLTDQERGQIFDELLSLQQENTQ